MTKKSKTYILIGVIAACVCALVFIGIKGNVTYYYTVTEAVNKAAKTGTDRFRLAGVVKNGSIKTRNGQTDFIVTDGDKAVNVTLVGIPPEMMKDAIPVVVEGSWKEGKLGKQFNADRVMVKHGNEYTPPTVKQDNNE